MHAQLTDAAVGVGDVLVTGRQRGETYAKRLQRTAQGGSERPAQLVAAAHSEQGQGCEKHKVKTTLYCERMPLTYVRMVLRQHTTPELQRLFLHRKRILVPSKVRVRQG